MFKLSMPNLPVETSEVLYDVSRLLRSRHRAFGTGVDRIDLAIGLNLAKQFGQHCHFLYAGPAGVAHIPHVLGMALLEHLDARWHGSREKKLPTIVSTRLATEPHLRGFMNSAWRRIVHPDITYVVASHSGLGRIPNGIRRLDPQNVMRRIIYLHDIIPLEMPEYQRPHTKAEFRNYLRELTNAPIVVASNSDDTERRVKKLAIRDGWQVTKFVVAKPTLTELPFAEAAPRPLIDEFLSDPRPFFVTVGTIEPRKNHLLLLNLWRQMAEEGVAPRLCIIGKRGWENENVVDMLDRCDAIRDSVTEFGGLLDHEVQVLMRTSAALLYPSFTEGLGVPMLEAAALNLPCIASDIPVFREVAPAGTVFLDPLDGLGWKQTVLSMARGFQDRRRQA